MASIISDGGCVFRQLFIRLLAKPVSSSGIVHQGWLADGSAAFPQRGICHAQLNKDESS
ncbi:MAG: hypothetical protein WBV22_04385 [Anaerolineaceae bacterium]